LLLLFGIIFRIKLATPQFLFLFWLSVTVSTIFIRVTIRVIMERLRLKGINLHNIIIVGTNRRARAFAHKIDSKPELGYRVVGFVDDDWEGTRDFQKSGYVLVSTFQDFSSYIRNNVVDEVVIDLPLNTFYQQAAEVVAHCVEQGIIVRFISDSFYLLRNMKLARSKMEMFDDNILISVYTGAMGGWPIVAKRIFDLVASLLLIGLLGPLIILIACLIKVSSPGPIFFCQERIGLNKRRFWMYKFRTMIPDAENKMAELEHLNEVSGPVFKIRNDPRVTPLGRILRKTSLDELPQLINVLQGDMSLVGPRPLPVRDYNGFSKDWQRRRFSVPPGITCFWQISGRSNISFDEWMHLDMQYIDQWKFGLDLNILIKTIPAVFTKKGAY
jgi:exopolysaccharide biosynthesis polyprenyl glycosylphosphotransferase